MRLLLVLLLLACGPARADTSMADFTLPGSPRFGSGPGGVPLPVTGPLGGPLPVSGSVGLARARWWLEAQGVTVAAMASASGAPRSLGVPAGADAPFGYFQATIIAAVAGTLTVSNGAISYTLGVTALTPATLKVPAFGAAFTSSFTAGATGGVFTLLDGFTAD